MPESLISKIIYHDLMIIKFMGPKGREHTIACRTASESVRISPIQRMMMNRLANIKDQVTLLSEPHNCVQESNKVLGFLFSLEGQTDSSFSNEYQRN